MAKESVPISKGLQFLLETDTLRQPQRVGKVHVP